MAANDIAINSGNARSANMAILGAYIGRSKVLPVNLVIDVVKTTFASKPQALEINLQAFQIGLEKAREN